MWVPPAARMDVVAALERTDAESSNLQPLSCWFTMCTKTSLQSGLFHETESATQIAGVELTVTYAYYRSIKKLEIRGSQSGAAESLSLLECNAKDLQDCTAFKIRSQAVQQE